MESYADEAIAVKACILLVVVFLVANLQGKLHQVIVHLCRSQVWRHVGELALGQASEEEKVTICSSRARS